MRPAGVAAPARAARESSSALAATSGVPASSSTRRATSRRSSIGVEVPPVTPTMRLPSKTDRVGEVRLALDLDRGLAGDADEAGQLLRVRARAAADHDHQVDLAGRLDRVLLAPDRDRADRVDDLQLVASPDHERGELLELPGRLGRLGDQRHPLLARDLLLPLLLFVDDDRIGREAEHADDLGVVRRAEQHDRVALVDELRQLLVLLDDPGAGAVDDLEAALVGPIHHVGADAVGPDDDGRAVIDIVERVDGLDPEPLEVGDHALVVDDLAEGMGQLARGGRLLGLVDRLADAVTEAGPLRDPDRFNGSHTGSSIAWGPVQPGSVARSRPRDCPDQTTGLSVRECLLDASDSPDRPRSGLRVRSIHRRARQHGRRSTAETTRGRRVRSGPAERQPLRMALAGADPAARRCGA